MVKHNRDRIVLSSQVKRKVTVLTVGRLVILLLNVELNIVQSIRITLIPILNVNPGQIRTPLTIVQGTNHKHLLISIVVVSKGVVILQVIVRIVTGEHIILITDHSQEIISPGGQGFISPRQSPHRPQPTHREDNIDRIFRRGCPQSTRPGK